MILLLKMLHLDRDKKINISYNFSYICYRSLNVNIAVEKNLISIQFS